MHYLQNNQITENQLHYLIIIIHTLKKNSMK
jgi:hypothetical protein